MTEASRRAEVPRQPVRHRVSLPGVFGELLITAGVLVLLFLGWQLWLNDIIVGRQQRDVAIELSEQWERAEGAAPVAVDPGEPVVAGAPANAVTFATLYVPRFGDDYVRPIAEGIGTSEVLNKIGFGHYPETQMPGEVGNFAIAAHRKAYGGNLEKIHTLEIGDSIYVETESGWFKYLFRTLEYVLPTGVGVIDPVPQQTGVVATDRIITLTSCNPFYSTAERIIAYGVYDTWFPRSSGPPDEIAATVQAGGR